MTVPYTPKTLEEFVEYCHCYDSTVVLTSGSTEPDDDYDIPYKIYFKCEAKQYLRTEPAKVIEYFKKHPNIINETQPNRRAESQLNSILNCYFVYKEYVYYETPRDNYYWVLTRKRTPESTRLGGEFVREREYRGTGKTVAEAEKKLIEVYAKYLEKRDNAIRFWYTQPRTTDEFIKICNKCNITIEEGSCKIKVEYVDDNIRDINYKTYIIKGDSTEFECRVDVNLSSHHSRWTVIRYHPVEVEGFGNTLEEALQEYENEYNSLRRNPKLWQEALEDKREKDWEEQLRVRAVEGEEHINWLLAECGEDVFPDRD